MRLRRLRRLHVNRAVYALIGAALIVAGVASVSIPVAIILAGLLLIGLSIEVRQ